MREKIKICGLRTKESIDVSLKYGANCIGFVFFAKSVRNINISIASDLRIHIAKSANVVAVTVNSSNDLLDQIFNYVNPNFFQLHGSETPYRVSEIKKRYNLPVIKSISISEKSDLKKVFDYYEICDRILFDTKSSKNSSYYGGSGISFNWNILNNLDKKIKYILSGGLCIENISKAIYTTKADGIDVSSGVEIKPGIKDINEIKNFLKTSIDAYQRKTIGNNK